MKIDKKYLNIMLISLITVGIYSVLNNGSAVMDFFKGIFGHFTVFIIGGTIAFLLNPVLCILEKKFKFKRKTSMIIIYASLIITVTIFVLIVIPSLFKNISDLVKNFPVFLNNLEKFIDTAITKINLAFPFFNITLDQEQIDKLNQYMLGLGQDALKIIGQNILDLTYLLLEFFIGFVMSIFFLGEKEYFRNLIVDVIKVNFSKEKNEKIHFFGKKLYEIFLGYLQGKTVESILIGFIAFIGLLYFKVPYSVFLWIFITCTNFIPYFGPFLGMIVTVIISAFVFPQKIIYIVIFLVLLQQIDSWYFEPKIIGDKLNLKMFWGIAAITIGGSIAGPVGIVLSAPLASFIKTMYQIKKEKMENRVSG